MILIFKAKVWKWKVQTADGVGWHFATLDKKTAGVVQKGQEGKKRIGWGSVPVVATIGGTSWKTSIFPDKKSASYLLPLKVQVRKKESIAAGDTIKIALQL